MKRYCGAIPRSRIRTFRPLSRTRRNWPVRALRIFPWNILFETQDRREPSRRLCSSSPQRWLRSRYSTDEGLSGADDTVIASRSRSEDRVLVTLDLDFANVLAYPPAQHARIIVLRSKRLDKP